MPKKGEAFTPPSTDEPATTFNLRRWIDGKHVRVVKRVEVILAPGLEAEVEDLDAELVRARNRGESDAVLEDLAERVEAARAEMEESRTVFKFRGLTSEEIESLDSEKVSGESPVDATMRMIALQCVSARNAQGEGRPSAEQFRELANELEGYFANTILRAAAAANTGGGVTIPFSLSASAILARRDS